MSFRVLKKGEHMKNTIRLFLLVCTILSLATQVEAKTRVALGTVEGTNVEKTELKTLENLIISEIIRHKKALYTEYSSDADSVINANLMALDYEMILTITYVGIKNSKSEQLKLYSFDEIDVATKRLVAAVIEGKPVQNTKARGDIVMNDKRDQEQYNSIRGFLVSLGIATPLNTAIGDYKPMYNVGLAYRFDVDRFLLEVRSDFQVGYNESDMSLFNFSLGGNYIFYENRSLAAYAGADVGFGFVHPENTRDGQGGFMTNFNVGAVLLRYADVNLDVRLRTSVMANMVNNLVPVTTGVLVGISF